MATIQCLRCKAINENVSSNDPCRQCGTLLDAPLSAIDGGFGPASSAYNGADRMPSKDSAPAPRADSPAPTSSASVTPASGARPPETASAGTAGAREPDAPADRTSRGE